MRKKIFFELLILVLIQIEFGHAYYSLWEQDIFVEKNSHILINLTDISGLVSGHVIDTSGNIQITLVIIKQEKK